MSTTVPWTAKYAPQKLEDIREQSAVVTMLCAHLADAEKIKSLPHLLLYGPPGIGKTTCIMLLARRLYGHLDEGDRRRSMLSLNASHDRGIAVVRNKITPFAATLPAAGAPFKLVVLDECDNMTAEAQDAMRRTMETFSGSTRFMLMCNYLSRVSAPLVSRCHCARFCAITGDAMVRHLALVARREQFRCDERVLREVDRVVNGDMRAALNLLQHLHIFYGDNVCAESVAEAAGDVPQSVVDALFDVCTAANDSDFCSVCDEVRIVAQQAGYAPSTILHKLADCVLRESALAESVRARIIDQMARAEYAIRNGGDEYLQLLAVCARLYEAARGARH